jgi:hypothetical protein
METTITVEDIKNNKKIKLNIEEVIEKLYYNEIDLDKKYKENISNYEGKIPLYDIYTSNLYLIHPSNLFKRISYNHYRFPTEKLLNELEKDINKFKKENKDDILINKKIKKFNLMKDFLSNFDLKILEDTFYRTMYKNSPELGKNLLFCKRPSFNKFIHNSKPYYSKTEIINMSLNMGKTFDINKLNDKNIDELCEFIKNNDINSEILLEHQKHIVNNDMLGLIQYYTVQGSANLNAYLRNSSFSHHENIVYNKIIMNLWKLCNTAPVFDKEYIVYRFIKEDSFLNNIKIGDTYEEVSFMSTTRDAFYRSDTYTFGFILMKIHIPKNKKGVALCLEACSHFPEEQEIIFPPGTKLKLISKDENTVYYNTDINFTSKVKTKYEFEWVGLDEPIINNVKKDKLNTINFLDKQLDKSLSLTERIKRFSNNLSSNSQCEVEIKDKSNNKNKNFIIIGEKYNSLGAYKNFYGIKTENGFSLYCIYDNYLLFFMEIGMVNNIEELHFNYYVRYNTLNKEEIIKTGDMIHLIASIAYYFALDRVIIYSEYKPCLTFNINKSQRDENNKLQDDMSLEEYTGNYCEDFYLYLKSNKKRFFDDDILELELTPAFSFYDLDYLKTLNDNNFFTKEDDELYQIYNKYYILENKKNTISDYFIWIIENKCYLIDKFIKKLSMNIYSNINPFKRDMYIFTYQNYLYNRGKINAFHSYYELDITERDNIIIKTDEFKKINMMVRD